MKIPYIWSNTQRERMTNGMDMLQIIKNLLRERGKTQSQLCDYLGLNKQAFTDWNAGRTNSYVKYLPKIAEFLDVKVDVLYGVKSQSYFHTMPVGRQTELPVYGDVSAGFGVYAQDKIIGYEVADARYSPEEYFFLVVHGDSMSPQINNGDYVLVHSQDYIESGQIGVCVVDGEGLIKKIEYGEDFITLISFNPYYPPRTFSKSDMQFVHILGRVLELKRKF